MADWGYLVPVLFQGPMTSELLDSLLCYICGGKTLTCKTCICKEHNLGCTELCPCYGSDGCYHPYTHKDASDDNTDVVDDDDLYNECLYAV